MGHAPPRPRRPRVESPPVGSVSGDRVDWLTRQYIEIETLSGNDFEAMLDTWLGREVDDELVLTASALVNGMSVSAGTIPFYNEVMDQARFGGLPWPKTAQAETR